MVFPGRDLDRAKPVVASEGVSWTRVRSRRSPPGAIRDEKTWLNQGNLSSLGVKANMATLRGASPAETVPFKPRDDGRK